MAERRYLSAERRSSGVTSRPGWTAPWFPPESTACRTAAAHRAGGEARKRFAGKGFPAAMWNAQKFVQMSGMTWRSMISEGLAMRHGKELSRSQVVMAAYTPMLLTAGLVEGNTHAGVLASGQVAGILDDLPSCVKLIDTIVSDAIKHRQAAAALVE
jgi:NAD(P)H-dependent flavin oxidoreductase YrpB (nitropropane dioxygenase family)